MVAANEGRFLEKLYGSGASGSGYCTCPLRNRASAVSM